MKRDEIVKSVDILALIITLLGKNIFNLPLSYVAIIVIFCIAFIFQETIRFNSEKNKKKNTKLEKNI